METQQDAPKSMAPFFTIWAGQIFSLVGSSMAQFALVWWLTEKTGSATVLATATLVSLLPGVILGPFVGALVDRWNRRLVMIVADGFIALLSAWLAYVYWTGEAQVWHIYVVMLARALGGAFHWPSMQASTSLMVPKEHLARVAGLNQTLHGVLGIVSPPLGAFLLGLLPLHGIMGIDVVTALIAIVPLFFVSVPQPQRDPAAVAAKGQPSLWADVREGLLYIWHWPGALALLVMATMINFLVSPGFALLPLLVTRHFGGEALELGWINSAWGIGLAVGGLALGVWGGFRRRIVTSLMGLIGMGIGVLVVGAAPSTAFWLAVGAMFAAGVMNVLCNGPLHAILQAMVAPDMQGRVFTVVAAAAGAMSPLGMAVAGPVSEWLGIQSWFLIGGVATTLMGVVSFFIPVILHMEDNNGRGKAGSPARVEVPISGV